MVQKSKVTKAEKARRQAQSSRDKKTTVKQTIPRQPKAARPKARSQSGGGGSYAKLVLDPCHGPLTQTNLPGSAGGQQVRCPFRVIATMPSTTVGVNGAAVSGGTNQNTLFGILTPHAMVPGSGPAAISVVSADNETYVRASFAAPGQYSIASDPTGLSSMAAMAGEMRPVAACIRISCLSTDVQNSGLFFLVTRALTDSS